VEVAIIADVHVANHTAFGGVSNVRKNERCMAVLDTLDAAVNVAKDAGCLVVAGDLFDNDRPFPDHIQAVGEILARHPNVVVIVGNHDQHSAVAGDHALAPLALIPSVTVVEDTKHVPLPDGGYFTALPFHADVLNVNPRGKVVVAHHGIADEKTPPFLRHGKGTIQTKDIFVWMRMHGVKVYVAGDWHEHKHWCQDDMSIVQCGALCPTGWNNPGHYGYGSVIFTDGATWRREVVNGPRFLYGGTEDDVLTEVRKALKRGDTPYLKAACAAFEHEGLAGAKLEWSPAIARAEGAVRVAAEHLKSTETLDECVASYVQADELIPEDMKPDVLQFLTELMAGSRA